MAIEKRRFKSRKEREEEKKKQSGYFVLPTFEEIQAIEQKAKEDAAKTASSGKGLEFFQKPSSWEDGYQFGDVTKTALGTLGDIGVGAVKGVMKIGEGVGDALQYGAAAVTDLFGADETADRIRRNAQRDAVGDAFSGVDDYLDRYSVLGRTSDAAAESLGQIGGVLATGGLAGAAGLGAAGTTAVTTGVMGLSGFGSGTGEAYAAGAGEGEAEAYGAIAGAADALSEMIFGGLGRGINALGISKGLSSADDMLAKAVSSKIKNTIAKNTVQLGIKAGAEGLEEVLAGTMQAAGKKMTYMSEQDFRDILADENLLEQFVVSVLASGVAQAPGYVSSNRAGVDLVSDDAAETATEGAQDAQGLSADTQRHNAEIERTGRAAGADKGSVRIAQDVYAAVGIPVSFFREEASGGTVKNGYYHNGTIYVNTASKNPVASIISHELTHSIEQGEAYQRLQNLVLRRMMDEGTDMEAAYREKEMLYTKAGITLRSADDIAHELVAEYVETKLLTDADSITSLVSEDRTLGQRIRAWLDSVLARLGNASAQQRDFVRRARDLYARALGESGTAEQNGQTGGKKYSLTGVNGNGIEIYETSPETVALSWSERKKKYLDIMRDEYRGRTAKFVRNGHVYYAQYDPNSLRKPIYGDNRSSPNGVRALIKAGADGDFFELVENSKYTGSAVNTKDHTKADYFDYFVKTVQIDGKVFDLMADVEKNNNVDGGYVYTLALVDNKKIKASPAHGTPTVPVNNAGNTSVDSISQNGEKVKRKFSVSEVAEETRDLIAVHNLNAEKLIKSLNLGGLPMPSIAIAKAEGGHEAFGDISLVFDKSTIDPERKTTNKVYSGDAWTPTYPRVEYKVNDAVESRVRTKYYDIAKRIGYDEARAMYRYAENLDDSLSRDGGEEAMLARLYDDTGMMQIYLQDTGRGKVEPITREVREEITADQAQQNQFMIDALGEELIAEFAVPDGQKPMTHRRAYMEAHDAEIRDAYRRMFIEREGFTAEDAEAIVSATTTRDLMHIVRDAYQYTKNQGVTIRTETDTTATNDAIRTAAADGYKEWIDGLFSGVQEKTGIRNNQDAFTKTGNRRSWDATHYAETLENVVLAMRESGEKGIGGFGGGNIFGAATQEFSTVADIKRASDRLQNLPQEEIDAIKDEFRERFAALARSLPKNTDSYTATDDAANMLVEAVAKYKTKSGMANYLRRESQGWADYSPAVVDELVSLVNEIRQMPTGYFEAKPQRAVGFDEVAAFVIPRNADIKVKQELLNRGYSIAEYDPDIEGDRAKVLNGMDKYKFSISPSFETEIDAWDRQTEGFAFVVGNTSEALQKAGIPKKQIRMDATKIKKLLDKHSGMTVDIIKQIPRLLEEPVIVIDSKQDSNSKIVMGELYDDNEKPVTAVLLLAPTSRGGNVLDMIKISSAEGRGHIGSLFRKEDGTPVEVRYVDKERIHDWLYVNRLQLPLRNLGLDSDDSISRNDDNVKRKFSVSEVDEADPLAGVSSAVETEVEEIDVPSERRNAARMEYGESAEIEVTGETDPKLTRKVLHQNIVDGIKEAFSARGLDFDKVLAKAKDLSTFATVDNTPQRVMERALGYKEGGVLADLTVNQTAKNESEGIRWLNQFTDRKDGILAQLSKKYNIKPGSKESAAAQMYAEGFYVDEYNEIIKYGDQELAADFPDAQVRENIKGLAHDPVVRQIYDETLDAINESRTRNAYPEIQKLDNYYLHFRAMDDTFSRLGIPFNPNDIRAKDLPTDLSGVTADLKPGQPYFASAKHRLGKRTSFDLLGGLEQYLTSAKNQIYHIDDIQTLRALRNYIADMYGQANGLEGLDALEEEAVQERIRQVYGSHLSTFAKFLNEEANILAGKTSLIDRGLEGIIGRRGITFLNDLNRQVGANMVGFNISSSLTNFLAPVQAFAKMNKAAFVRGFAQTVENRIKSITGNGDDFAQTSDVIVRRKGADRFNRTLWQKMSDPGYLLMGMVDDISTEIIARAKYNELTAKGMDAETVNRETDKWVSRLMGDRSIGQMPQIYNSKMLGMITKFQLEVRNQLDSQFYDTIKEAQTDYAEIGDKTKRNAKIAAKVAATLAELAVAQHVFGQVFEEIAGYNPAFDIIEVIATVLGLDDDEESEDTVLDNIEQGVLALIEDLPYSSVFTEGGRIPIGSALPIGEFITGEDQYGNEVNRLKTAAEALPYYVLPGGYGQIKKTAQGLSMFMGDKDVTGSYTDSGNLRFPVEATPGNVAQAAVFGQWASENARDYFDNERSPISERQAQGYAESGLDWKDYQKYKAQITKLEKDSEKASVIKELDISADAKEALYRSLVASAVKDEDGNIVGSSEDERLQALYAVGLDFDDFLDAKIKQSSLSADESLSGNGRAARFLAWGSGNGYTDEQADVIGEQFSFASGFRVQPTTYQKMVDGGVEPENAVTVTDALSGAERDIDKINAIWGTGIIGKQLDAAIKAVVSETQYNRYRIIIDANVPLEIYTWVLDNADADGNGSISNDERILALSRLALPQSDLSALWLATGGSEKSNPYGDRTSSLGITMPQINLPKIEIPKLDLDIPMFDFQYNLGGNK